MTVKCIWNYIFSQSYKVAKNSQILPIHRHLIDNQIRKLSVHRTAENGSNILKNEAVQQTHEQKSQKLTIKPPRGTRDFNGADMIIKRKIFNHIAEVFQMHGAAEIETPVFELKETLTGKYGQDDKLVYDLQDQGGEILAMRYDLTIPFARYLSTNRLQKIKRFNIGRVYRRDSPSFNKGRYREFYQCDFDISGSHDSMIPDAECIQVTDQILAKLNIGKYVIKINHRKLLDGIFSVCGVPTDKFRQICSAVDKVDKIGWASAKQEMVEQKGLPSYVADKIGEYVKLNGGIELLLKLMNESEIKSSPQAQEGLKELQLLYEYCSALSCDANLQFDMGLARGLDYYTGVIFEAVVHELNTANDEEKIGSVAGGGRYDDLVEIINSNDFSVPCVGVSFGVERLFTILEHQEISDKGKLRSSHTQVLVCSPCKNFLLERLRIVSILHKNGIFAETIHKVHPRLLAQFTYADENGIPFVLITGEDELSENIVKLRTMANRKDEALPNDAFVQPILEKLEKLKHS